MRHYQVYHPAVWSITLLLNQEHPTDSISGNLDLFAQVLAQLPWLYVECLLWKTLDVDKADKRAGRSSKTNPGISNAMSMCTAAVFVSVRSEASDLCSIKLQFNQMHVRTFLASHWMDNH